MARRSPTSHFLLFHTNEASQFRRCREVKSHQFVFVLFLIKTQRKQSWEDTTKLLGFIFLRVYKVCAVGGL
ncbi:MAG: hypothetical protein ACI9FN_001542 [Saprospiraceae bacterium]|jgi:hypothetical protein